jgi:ABC-2 type transport system permease protein
MRPVVAIAGIALKRYFRDRSNYFFVLVLPMLLVVAIGLQFGDSGAAGRLILTGSGPLSDRLASALDDQRIAVERSDDAARAKEVVARGRSDAAVIVDPDDETRWSAQQPVEITIIPGSQAGGQATTATVRSVLDSLSLRRAASDALQAQQIEPEEVRAGLDGGRGRRTDVERRLGRTATWARSSPALGSSTWVPPSSCRCSSFLPR